MNWGRFNPSTIPTLDLSNLILLRRGREGRIRIRERTKREGKEERGEEGKVGAGRREAKRGGVRTGRDGKLGREGTG